MEISFGPFLTCFFAIMFLTIYLYIILYRARNVFAKNTKWLFLGILLIFIRLSVPVNFPFTYSVYSEKFLPRFTNPLCDNKIGNLSIYDCLLILWISVAVIKVLIFFYRKIRLGNYLKNFTQNSDHTDPLYQMLRKIYSGSHRDCHYTITDITGYYRYFIPNSGFSKKYISFRGRDTAYMFA